MIEKEVIHKLIDEAIKARAYSYSPYSKFKVGAALLLKNARKSTSLSHSSNSDER